MIGGPYPHAHTHREAKAEQVEERTENRERGEREDAQPPKSPGLSASLPLCLCALLPLFFLCRHCHARMIGTLGIACALKEGGGGGGIVVRPHLRLTLLACPFSSSSAPRRTAPNLRAFFPRPSLLSPPALLASSRLLAPPRRVPSGSGNNIQVGGATTAPYEAAL
jgi:hypothetical protein